MRDITSSATPEQALWEQRNRQTKEKAKERAQAMRVQQQNDVTIDTLVAKYQPRVDEAVEQAVSRLRAIDYSGVAGVTVVTRERKHRFKMLSHPFPHTKELSGWSFWIYPLSGAMRLHLVPSGNPGFLYTETSKCCRTCKRNHTHIHLTNLGDVARKDHVLQQDRVQEDYEEVIKTLADMIISALAQIAPADDAN